MTRRQFQLCDDPAEAYSLKAALHNPVGWPRPLAGFEERCMAALRNARLSALPRSAGRLSRPMKIAASVAAMAALAGFASWIAVESLSEPEPAPQVVQQAVDEETELITKESGKNMIVRKMAGIVGAALMTLPVGATTEAISSPTFVFLRPETSSFWHTATNNVMTVPVDFPAGATSASLYVSGVAYNCRYDDIQDSSFTFELPPAESEATEDVYDLRLEFNDPDATVRTAKLGLIRGLSPDAEGTTRCLAPASGKVWSRVQGHAVLPIPYGTTSFTVDGESRDTGLDGAQGWYALRLRSGQTVSLSLIANEIQYDASLVGNYGGLMLIFK